MSERTLESPLGRLHQALVQALRERDPSGLGRPFTVAEIYQDLVPYRTHRDTLGVEMNGDYEHLLLRLLSGEDDLVSIESEHARKEIQDELGRSNPNTGLFREYAAVDVQLVAEHIPPEDEVDDGGQTVVILPEPAADADDESPRDVDAASVDDLAPSDAPDDTESAPITGETVVLGDDGVCFWCRETLPLREHLNFCPFCGTDVAVVPCPSCGEAVEPGWRFCIQCGASTDPT